MTTQELHRVLNRDITRQKNTLVLTPTQGWEKRLGPTLLVYHILMIPLPSDSDLFLSLSYERMATYCLSGDVEAGILRYQKNIALSEAFYPILAILEVCMRNHLAQQLSRLSENTWHLAESNLLLHKEQETVRKAINLLQGRKKPTSQGALIAELNFGFWVTLFHPTYERLLWPELLKAFPYCPRYTRARHKLYKLIKPYHHLRNRIFHHEPILDWNNLPELHQQAHELIGWMNPAAQKFLADVDRFETVWETL